MKISDLTVKILAEIRDSVREANGRIDQTNTRLDQTIVGMNTGFELLADRITHSEIRVATAIAGLAGTLDDVKSLLKDRLALGDRGGRCEN